MSDDCAALCQGCVIAGACGTRCVLCLFNQDNQCLPYRSHVGCMTIAMAPLALCVLCCPIDAFGYYVEVPGKNGSSGQRFLAVRRNYDACSCVTSKPKLDGFRLVRRALGSESSSAFTSECDVLLELPQTVNSQHADKPSRRDESCDGVVRLGTRAW
jgi:hypothetical protein